MCKIMLPTTNGRKYLSEELCSSIQSDSRDVQNQFQGAFWYLLYIGIPTLLHALARRRTRQRKSQLFLYYSNYSSIFFLISTGEEKTNKTDSLFSMLGFAPSSNSQVCHCWPSFHPGSDLLSGFWVVIVIGGVLESEKSSSSRSREVVFSLSPNATCTPRSGSWTFFDKLTVKTVRRLRISPTAKTVTVSKV